MDAEGVFRRVELYKDTAHRLKTSKKTQIKENFEDEFRPKNFYLIITAVGCGTSRTPSPTVGAEPNCTLYPFAFFGLRRMNASLQIQLYFSEAFAIQRHIILYLVPISVHVGEDETVDPHLGDVAVGIVHGK